MGGYGIQIEALDVSSKARSRYEGKTSVVTDVCGDYKVLVKIRHSNIFSRISGGRRLIFDS